MVLEWHLDTTVDNFGPNLFTSFSGLKVAGSPCPENMSTS